MSSSKSLKFSIVTPERMVFEAPHVESITLPTKMGEITILSNHLPLVSALVAGEVRVKVGGEDILMAVSGGFIEVRPGQVIVLADTAERAEEINEQRAEEARQRAVELMKQERVAESDEYAGLAAKLERELARLKVVRKHHNQPHPRVVE